MNHPRAKPLDVCPNLVCRRSRHCCNETNGLPCRKTHFMNEDERRDALARRLHELADRYGAPPSDPMSQPTQEEMAQILKIVREAAAARRSANVLAGRDEMS